ncbi:hypothetical protein K458DRAFT_211370 [Lentithecium fluviatile CBS 122367]|uniref:Uncharacterized protein n=1 Tax=Lentithecium fluviatile CBS 122367 TaxID=1168545 RepID=A0A6G1J846_9PLEO|nr:hypothetical protein K458DRAFT_211370 [Lentithecium fluviatile CBS 122367]
MHVEKLDVNLVQGRHLEVMLVGSVSAGRDQDAHNHRSYLFLILLSIRPSQIPYHTVDGRNPRPGFQFVALRLRALYRSAFSDKRLPPIPMSGRRRHFTQLYRSCFDDGSDVHNSGSQNLMPQSHPSSEMVMLDRDTTSSLAERARIFARPRRNSTRSSSV